MVVQCRHRHLRLLPLAGLVIQEPELEGSPARRLEVVVVDDPVERELHVVGGERGAVVPLHVVAQIEHPAKPVVGTLPRLGQQRLDLIVQPRGFGEALEQVPQHARRSGVPGQREVEREGLGDRRHRERAPMIADLIGESLGVPAQFLHDGHTRNKSPELSRRRHAPAELLQSGLAHRIDCLALIGQRRLGGRFGRHSRGLSSRDGSRLGSWISSRLGSWVRRIRVRRDGRFGRRRGGRGIIIRTGDSDGKNQHEHSTDPTLAIHSSGPFEQEKDELIAAGGPADYGPPESPRGLAGKQR